jgi:hypothetical protein
VTGDSSSADVEPLEISQHFVQMIADTRY